MRMQQRWPVGETLPLKVPEALPMVLASELVAWVPPVARLGTRFVTDLGTTETMDSPENHVHNRNLHSDKPNK